MSSTKVYPVKKAVFWKQTVMGLLWIGAGILSIFDNVVCKVLRILFLVAAIIGSVKSIKMAYIGDDADEMAENDYARAKAYAGETLEIMVCFMLPAFVFGEQFLQSLDVNWLSVIPQLGIFFVGVYNLLSGLIFRKLEAE